MSRSVAALGMGLASTEGFLAAEQASSEGLSVSSGSSAGEGLGLAGVDVLERRGSQ